MPLSGGSRHRAELKIAFTAEVDRTQRRGCYHRRPGVTRATCRVVMASVIQPEFAIVEPPPDHEHLRPSGLELSHPAELNREPVTRVAGFASANYRCRNGFLGESKGDRFQPDLAPSRGAGGVGE